VTWTLQTIDQDLIQTGCKSVKYTTRKGRINGRLLLVGY
jgi:hypothetical protein